MRAVPVSRVVACGSTLKASIASPRICSFASCIAIKEYGSICSFAS
jgi:hypothetical protein